MFHVSVPLSLAERLTRSATDSPAQRTGLNPVLGARRLFVRQRGGAGAMTKPHKSDRRRSAIKHAAKLR